ncbi:hypothetical protein dsx2_2643 [Desulfovibrio sp. X2]|uniref:hypothetical protein n=1 Tax=Desulfovibrio sp. X2 TaxID=941449 RepID=UPI000358A16D|nr:hypothetical protein [Desulfovibrio sp. X2]EPR42726.1 hypothetical protein dsx2_2643 [Desulfovibrio sp. X2]
MGALSVVGICNMALTSIGEEVISSLDQNTKAASLCAVHYDTARRETLEAHEWNFATRYQALAMMPSSPTSRWAYAFKVPSDCVKARSIADDMSAPFEVAGDLLLTDQPSVTLIYTTNVTDVSLFTGRFSRTLSFLLASLLAVPMSQSESKSQRMLSMYVNWLAMAEEVDATEGEPEEPETSEWIRVRTT